MFSVEKIRNEFIISIFNAKRLNILISEDAKSQIMEFMAIPNSKISLNLSGVHFIDSAAFEMLREVNELAKVKNCQFQLINLSDETNELVDLLSLRQELIIN